MGKLNACSKVDSAVSSLETKSFTTVTTANVVSSMNVVFRRVTLHVRHNHETKSMRKTDVLDKLIRLGMTLSTGLLEALISESILQSSPCRW
jgi:hypothetical protein